MNKFVIYMRLAENICNVQLINSAEHFKHLFSEHKIRNKIREKNFWKKLKIKQDRNLHRLWAGALTFSNDKDVFKLTFFLLAISWSLLIISVMFGRSIGWTFNIISKSIYNIAVTDLGIFTITKHNQHIYSCLPLKK